MKMPDKIAAGKTGIERQFEQSKTPKALPVDRAAFAKAALEHAAAAAVVLALTPPTPVIVPKSMAKGIKKAKPKRRARKKP